MARYYDKIGGVWGDWTPVDSAKDLSVGQRVRYQCESFNCGYEGKIVVQEICEGDCTTWDGHDNSSGTGSLFKGGWTDIQAFVPETNFIEEDESIKKLTFEQAFLVMAYTGCNTMNVDLFKQEVKNRFGDIQRDVLQNTVRNDFISICL